ncbi:hypothetical protein K491DRAFT_610731, partial [Lophiostoma macrostomum CBS 122681]
MDPDTSVIYSNRLAKNSIRLLHLEPKSASGSLNCTLECVSLDNFPPFEALSYVWGDPGDTISMFCEGSLFEATRSLHTALTNLRLPNAVRTMWVDAICINQKDDVEKSRQVPLMGKIYSLAKKVVVWVGPFTRGDAKLAAQSM